MKTKFVEKRNRGTFLGYIVDMHSKENQTSWMRWMGTFIIIIIMTMWFLNCMFDGNWKFNLTLEDMPVGLLGIVITVIGGKVGQAIADRKKEGKA